MVGIGGLLGLGVEVSGNPSPSFQWSFNGAPIAGAVTSRYIVRHATLADAGLYSCTIANDKGTVVCKPITVSVNDGVLGVSISPSVDVSDGVRAGSSLTFSAQVTQGHPSMFLQWLLDGKPIPGANSLTYTIATVSDESCGNYSCRVLLVETIVSSGPVFVTLAAEVPLIDWHTNSKHVNLGKSEVLKVHALGIPSVSYQWYFNGAVIPGANAAELTFDCIEAVDCGRYHCKVR